MVRLNMIYYYIALTKKLIEKTKKEWEESVMRKQEEMLSSCSENNQTGLFDAVKVQIDESYLM